jgi:hypothetical protein
MAGEIKGHVTHKRTRSKGARMLVAFTVVFALTYFAVLGTVNENCVSKYLVAFFFFLLFLISAASPVAIYINSKKYRKQFNNFCLHVFIQNHLIKQQINQTLEPSS